jgi:hypothetical protein
MMHLERIIRPNLPLRTYLAVTNLPSLHTLSSRYTIDQATFGKASCTGLLGRTHARQCVQINFETYAF